MKKIIAATLALSLAGSAAFAGGPVVVPQDTMAGTAGQPVPKKNLLPLLLIPLLACAAVCGSDS